jgi:RNA polymerase sigma-70 factor (ECF subfamily)
MRILFARHNVRVYRFALRFVADKSTAEDVVSEVFLDVWRPGRQIPGPISSLPATSRLQCCAAALPKRSTTNRQQIGSTAFVDAQDSAQPCSEVARSAEP